MFALRDIEEWYISTLTRQGYIHKIFEKQAEIALANLEKIRARVGSRVQAVFICGTDFGTQLSTFCSIDTFRSLYMPYYRVVNDWIHKSTEWKTFKHSCGAVESLIPCFIESGFDILNPIQSSAAEMEPRKLKKKYGRDGGFIFNAVHNIQANVPIKNVVAVFEALKEFNGPR